MANVLRKFPETMTPKELYLMLKNPDSVKMSDAKGAVLHPEAYVLFEDVNQGSGEVVKIVSIRSGGKVYATNSASFIREFDMIAEAFGAEMPDIKVTTGKSSKGRQYVRCAVEL